MENKIVGVISLDQKKISKIRIVMCDMDGTLLTDEGKVSENTRKSIEKIRKKGILFGLCTGRDLTGVKNSLSKWGIEGIVDAIVGTGGSEICDFTKGYEQVVFPLEGRHIKEIMTHFEDMDLNFVIPHKGILHAPKEDRHIRLLAEVDGVPYKVTDFNEFLKTPKQKVMIMTDAETMDSVIKRAESFSSDEYKSVSLKTASVLYEYMDPRVSKTYGLEKILELHGLTMENLCTFGDAENDYDMTYNAGIGVVMANGSEKTKSVADFITNDNNNDGISEFLEKYII